MEFPAIKSLLIFIIMKNLRNEYPSLITKKKCKYFKYLLLLIMH